MLCGTIIYPFKKFSITNDERFITCKRCLKKIKEENEK